MPNIIDREKSPMRSLERALHILAILETAGSSMGLTELGRASQLSKPTVLRMLLVLEKYGFAEKRQGRYRLGAAVLPLAHAYLLGNELTRVTLPVLQELAESTGETTSLFVRLGFKRVLVQRIEGLHPMNCGFWTERHRNDRRSGYAREPFVPRLPPLLLKIDRTMATVRVLLSVRHSMNIATPPGPYPS
jgi:hypothetical protein